MKRIVIISLHAGYWLVYLFLTLSTLIIAGSHFKGSVYMSIALNTFIAVTCFYTFYIFLVPKLLAHRRVSRFLVIGLVTAFTSAVIIVAIQALVAERNAGTPVMEGQTDVLPVIISWTMIIAFHTIIGAIHGLLATFMRGFYSWYEDIHIRQQLEKKNLETQMSLLKARIDPHFLFNTLNNIDVLIKRDPSLASIYLQKLCSIMRFALYENQTDLIPLEKEIQILKEYIELQRIRSSRDFVSVKVTGEQQGLSIAPMVLLSFVENAIKHSDGQKTENAVSIEAAVGSNSTVEFSCRNIVSKRTHDTIGGIGIDLIKNRLNLLYPGKHSLELGERGGYFEVKLSILTK